ncbi:MAG: hypothetical protein ACQESK_01320 [Bacteroidota bacterium]
MIIKKILLSFCLFYSLLCFGQTENSSKNEGEKLFSRFEISANYGPAANFFVDYDRPMVRSGGSIEPLYSEVFDEFNLHQKNMIGTSGGISITYNFNEKNGISFSYDRTLNHGKYNGSPVLDNGTPIFIRDFKLRHLNQFFSLSYRRSLDKKNTFYASIGIQYLRHNQAEIDIAMSDNYVVIEERNYDNSGFEEGGFVLGLEKYFYKSGQFELGIQSKFFILTSGPGPETLTFTPVLKYSF